MTEIVGSIQRVTDIMSEIMAATWEQVDGIEQINQAVSQMDQVTQQNAALVEEAAAAAESMQDQAGKLVEVVSVFKTGQNTAAPTAKRVKTTTKTAVKPVVKQVASNRAPQIAAPKSEQSKGDDWEEF